MTILFQDGFESGDFSNWTSTEGAGTNSETVETNNPFQGKYNGKFFTNSIGAEATVYKTITSAAIVYLRFYLKIDALPASGDLDYYGSIADAVPSAGTGTTAAIINISGSYYWRLFVNGVEVNEATASNPTTGIYYCIELLRDKTNSIQKLWVNGVLKVTQNNAITNNATNIAVGVDYSSGGEALNCYCDSVIAADSYIGPAVTSVAFTENLITRDSTKRKVTYKRLETENLTIKDTFNRKIRYLRKFPESIIFRDIFARGRASYKRLQTQTTFLTDKITRKFIGIRLNTENLQLKDNLTRKFAGFYTFIEDLSNISDSLNRMVTIQDLIDELNNFAAAAKAALTELQNQIKKKYAKFKLRRT